MKLKLVLALELKKMYFNPEYIHNIEIELSNVSDLGVRNVHIYFDYLDPNNFYEYCSGRLHLAYDAIDNVDTLYELENFYDIFELDKEIFSRLIKRP